MKNVILWNHERGTWQYDIFCLLIIAFIFLTPPEWFEGKERDATPKALTSVQAQDSKNNSNKIKNLKVKAQHDNN